MCVTYIPNGTIVLVKDAVPNDAQDFGFSLNNNGTIDFGTSRWTTTPTRRCPNSLIASACRRAHGMPTESCPLPAGWSLTDLVCVDPTNNTTVDLATGTATINLASLETVTCTYTDTKAGHIIVKKRDQRRRLLLRV